MSAAVMARQDWWQAYLDTPWTPFGRGAEALDCWGLVRRVYADILGIDLPGHCEVAPADRRAVATAIAGDCDAGPWRAVPEPRAFDVMVARRPGWRVAGHVGVMLNRRDVLHTWSARQGVHVARVTDRALSALILGYQRHEAAPCPT